MDHLHVGDGLVLTAPCTGCVCGSLFCLLYSSSVSVVFTDLVMPTDSDGDGGPAVVPLDGEGDHIRFPASAGSEDENPFLLLCCHQLESDVHVQLADVITWLTLLSRMMRIFSLS